MGGDFAPINNLLGVSLAQSELSDDYKLVLFGDESIIKETAEKESIDLSPFEIVHAPEVIGMGEGPIKSISTKPNSSIVIGFKMLAEGKIDSFSSAGSTGAMLVGATQIINPIPGIIRPCITAIFPKIEGGQAIILDVGLNPDCKPDVLYQYGILGSIYAEFLFDVSDPKVGLLNLGEEEEKGNLLTRAAFQSMKNSRDFNFIGNIEGNNLFQDNNADVIVCDGFVGNIVLKETESFYKLAKAWNVKNDFISKLDVDAFGGTPILGINKPVLIGHGASSPLAIKSMLLHSRSIVDAEITDKIKKALNN